MKNNLITIITLIVIIGCVEKPRKKQNNQETETVEKFDEISFEDANCSSNFDKLFEKFAKDSSFQKERIKYPMKWSFYDEANYQELVTEIIESREKFNYFDFTKDKNAVNREYGAFEVNRINHNDSITYQQIGLDTGLFMSFKFQLIEGCWYLVSIIDEST